MLSRIAKLLRQMTRRHALYRVQRGELIPSLEPRIPLTFRQITRDNLSDILSFRSDEVRSVFDRHLANGQLGVFAYHQGQAIGHGWMVVNRGEKPIRANKYFCLRPREGLVHYCSVAEEHRGKGVFPAILCELYRRAFDTEPVDVIYIDTELDNAASRNAIAKTADFLRNAYYLNVWSRGYEVPWPLTTSTR